MMPNRTLRTHHLVDNIIGSLGKGDKAIQKHLADHFTSLGEIMAETDNRQGPSVIDCW
jgi:hypothetical protein